MSGPIRLLFVSLAVLGLFAGAPVHADRLVPRSGEPLRGAIVSETTDEVVFNPYWSRNPEMVWEVVRLPRKRVKRLEVAPHPEVEVHRRLAQRRDGDTAALLEIGAYAKENKLKGLARMCFAYALAEDPQSIVALKGIGGKSKWNAVRKGNLFLDAELMRALGTYVRTDDPAERAAQALAIKKQGLDLRPEALERHRRSARQPKGLMEDRPLSWRSDQLPGAVYTLFVPPTYDAVLPGPLLVGLHGGGNDGKLGDELVGDGRSAMNFYRDLAAKHGVLVACPTAMHAGWGGKDNEELVRAVIEEVKHLYNVDIDRIYLTGHSMGGFGTWALGPRLAEDLAAISPMAGGGGGGISQLTKTRTPIFIYHSDNDYVSVSSDRNAAKQLRDTDLDFVYTELPGKGHSLPESIREELFAFIGPRRRYDPRYRKAWPRSSFAGKVQKEEETYLGNPLDEIEGRASEPGDWLDWLALGGGRAARAVQRLEGAKPEGAAADVSKLVKNARLSFDARAWAARALGGLGDVSQAKALRRAVSQEATRPASRLVQEAARALARLQDTDGADAIGQAVEAWVAYYEDRVVGGKVRYSDWRRAASTLGVLVESWALVEARGSAAKLGRKVVDRVLAPGHEIQTSERIPQDVSGLRVALAKAVAEAYARWHAEDALVQALKDAVRSDPKALAAAGG